MTPFKNTISVLFIFISAFNLASKAQTPGTIDSSFAANGSFILALGSGLDNGNAVIVLPDDRILVAGITEKADFDWADYVLRLTPDGKIDSTFGTNGITIFEADTAHIDYAEGMTLQPDGKIIVVGGVEAGGDDINYVAARLSSDGMIDSSFGTNGIQVIHKDGGEDLAYKAAVQPDGKIVLAGQDYIPGMILRNGILLRLNSDGSLDSSFGASGFDTTALANDYTSFQDLLLMDDGSIVAAGYTGNNKYDLLAARYDSTGAPVADFGNNGIAIFNLNSGSDAAYSIVKDPLDGRILIGGQKGSGSSKTDFVLLAITPYGVLDSSFAVNGVASVNANQSEAILGLAVQQNGKIVASGTSGTLGIGTNNWAVLRFNEDGSVDSTFGESGGYTITAIGSFFSSANAIALQSSGKIITAGVSANTNNDIGVVRYFGDDIATGIDHITTTSASSVQLFPNPSNGVFKISLKTDDVVTTISRIQIMNLFGQIVFDEKAPLMNGVVNETVRMSDNAAAGSYFVKMTVRDKVYLTKLELH